MADLFEEVEEQLRSDRYRTLARKALPWVLGLAAVALIAALAWWGWTSWNERSMASASEQYNAAMESLQKGDRAAAEKGWTEVSKSPAKGYKSMALMQLGGLKVADNKTTEAVALFDEAAKLAPDPMLGDAARLKSALALLDTAPYSQVEGRLNPLLEQGRPYRVQAREALAFAKLMKGDTAGARGDFVVISGSLDAPEGARTRAKAAMDLIDSGSAKAIPAAVRAATALEKTQGAGLAPGLLAPAQPQATGPQ